MAFEENQIEGVKRYIVLDEIAFKKIMSLVNVRKFDVLTNEGKIKKKIVFLDTPNNLLTTNGIIISKVIENSKAYFIVERQKFLPKMFRTGTEKFCKIEINSKDKLMDHKLQVVDAITALYDTSISIDFENILKNALPKIETYTNANCVRLVNGSGLRAFLFFEEITYENLETGRKNFRLGLTVKMDCSKLYLNAFNEYIWNLERLVKELTPISENEFDYASRVTKKIDQSTEKLKDKRKKQKKGTKEQEESFD
ncbi:MAG: hypothetical protein RR140_02180 [Clostridia bacterium]